MRAILSRSAMDLGADQIYTIITAIMTDYSVSDIKLKEALEVPLYDDTNAAAKKNKASAPAFDIGFDEKILLEHDGVLAAIHAHIEVNKNLLVVCLFLMVFSHRLILLLMEPRVAAINPKGRRRSNHQIRVTTAINSEIIS